LVSIALNPLQRVAEVAERVQSGETNLRIRPEEMVVELGRLGEAFNAMLDRLESQLQAHARFTADISHELGNPLGSVMLQMQVASEEESSPEELRTTLRSCLEITRRMDHLRKSLLDLSLAQARQGTQNPVINLEPVVEEAVEAVEVAAHAKDVTIETDGTTALLPGNPELLYQLMVNLLNNAIRHTPEGSVVRVLVHPAEFEGKPIVSIGVLDEGRGVPPEDEPGLFERFFRSQSDRLVRPRGHAGLRTGLGLAICKSIAKAHQGIIRYSPGPQGGALFEVLLPAKSAQDQPG
jgi:signal transduction histidine kinase